MARKNDLKKLLATKTRRLQKLKEKEALQGVSVDPQILIEIEDLELEIEKLQAELMSLDTVFDENTTSDLLQDDLKFDYRLGLQFLKSEVIAEQVEDEIKLDFFTLENRLLANLNDGQRFGSTDTLISERNRIVRELARLSFKFNLDFNALCQGKIPENTSKVSQTLSKVELDLLFNEGQVLENAGQKFEAASKYWRIWQSFPEYRDVDSKLTSLEKADVDSFVGRQNELGELMHLLEQTVLGTTSVAFVSGEAGTGKTALIQQFFRQAQAKYGDLVYILGSCGAQSGVGEPYLPFKEIFSLLCGEISGQLAQANISITLFSGE